MLERRRWIVLLLFSFAAAGGCAARLQEPNVLLAPYPQTRIWAAAPFLNESGVSAADGMRFADAFLSQVEQVDGLEAAPLNRTLAAMQALGLTEIRTEAEARAVLNVLKVDAIAVGTLTSYDPYPPLQLGASVALITRERVDSSATPRELTLSVRGEPAVGDDSTHVSTASGVFDASNHRTLAWLQEFAKGRSVPESGFGPAIYEASITQYTEFVCYALIHDLLVRESARVEPAAAVATR